MKIETLELAMKIQKQIRIFEGLCQNGLFTARVYSSDEHYIGFQKEMQIMYREAYIAKVNGFIETLKSFFDSLTDEKLNEVTLEFDDFLEIFGDLEVKHCGAKKAKPIPINLTCPEGLDFGTDFDDEEECPNNCPIRKQCKEVWQDIHRNLKPGK